MFELFWEIYIFVLPKLDLLKIRLFILLFTIPIMIFGNSAVVLIETNDEAFEIPCCIENDASEDCCCDHQEQEKSPCQDGECTSSGCFYSIQHNLIAENKTEFTFLNFDILDKKIASVFNSSLPIVDQTIWIPPKIYS